MDDVELCKMATEDLFKVAKKLNDLSRLCPSANLMLAMGGCSSAITMMAMGLAITVKESKTS